MPKTFPHGIAIVYECDSEIDISLIKCNYYGYYIDFKHMTKIHNNVIKINQNEYMCDVAWNPIYVNFEENIVDHNNQKICLDEFLDTQKNYSAKKVDNYHLLL